jgi:hypothetical protein
MKARSLVLPLLLTLFIILMSTTSWGEGNRPIKPPPRNQVVDAANRIHVRPKPRVSDAQRKAAAQRRNAVRAKAAGVAQPKTKEAR